MKRFTSILLPLISIVAGLLVVWLSQDADDQRVADNESALFELGVRVLPGREITDTSPASRTKAAQLASPLSREAPEGAIPDEYTLTMPDQASFERVRRAAEARGIRIISAIPELRILQLSGIPSDLADMLGSDVDLGYNFPVEVPEMPDPYRIESAGLQSFETRALAFLGADRPDRAGWGEGLTVAVIDTGVGTHPALEGVDVRQLALPGVDLGTASSPEEDMSGHGLAVAAIIAGRDQYASGLAPSADLLSVAVLNANGEGNAFDLARGIVAAVRDGAKVINLSLGTYGESNALKAAVAYAVSHDVSIVAAVGNEGQRRTSFPAAYDGVIGVAAVDALSQVPDFSNYGPYVDIAAPGVGVATAWSGNSYVLLDGTSSATPFVTGALAQLRAQNPSMSAAEAEKLIFDYANESGAVGPDERSGHGILNMERILNRDVPGIYDLAAADFYFRPENANASSLPFEVTVENRGSEYLPAAILDVDVSGQQFTHYFATLAPNQSEAATFAVDPRLLMTEEGATFSARVRVPGGANADAQPANDTRETWVRINRNTPDGG